MYRDYNLLGKSGLLFITISLVFLVTACSGSGSPATPEISNPVTLDSIHANQSHNYLWYGVVSVNPASQTAEFIPIRISSTHFNVRTFMEDGSCTNCLSIQDFEILPDDIFSFDIMLTHPFPGLNNLTGFDVRGIVIFNASENWTGHSVTVSREALGDGELLNADGYTRLYNPVEFPPDSLGIGLWEYSQGKLAPPADLTGSLNGYVAYETDQTRHVFETTTAGLAHYEMKKPDGPFLFGYAIDANHALADPTLTGDPLIIDVPDDFPLEANCPEAYQLSTSATHGLFDDGSGTANIFVDVYDWQGDAEMAVVQVECPDLFAGLLHMEVYSIQADFVRFNAQVGNYLLTPEGEYTYLISVEDISNDLSPLPLVAYQFGIIEIAFAPVSEPVLITEIVDIFHSPLCAKVDTQTDSAYVNSTQAQPNLDYHIRRIDNDEQVEDTFNGSSMGGWIGLNVDARKVIVPQVLCLVQGVVEVFDLDDESTDTFTFPLGPMMWRFIGDGEIFHDLSVAAVVDSIEDELIVFDYTDPGTDFQYFTTNGFPQVIEADYEGHRLFIYCAGSGTEDPSVQVWDAETWTVTADFPTALTPSPFMSEIDYNPDYHHIYFGSSTDSFEVWDTETYTLITTISVGYGEVQGIDHMGSAIYVTTYDEEEEIGRMLVYDVATFDVLWDIPCGLNPRNLACNPNTKKIYVPDMDGQSVLVYQG